MLAIKKATVLVVLGTVFLVTGTRLGNVVQTASAKPAFMARYNADPYARPEFRNKCTLCHIGRGGAERNEFGDAFEDSGYRITAKLRRKFPDKFLKDDTPTPASK